MGCPIVKAELAESKEGSPHLRPKERGVRMLTSTSFFVLLMLALSIPCAAKDTTEFQGFTVSGKMGREESPVTALSCQVTIKRQSDNTGGTPIPFRMGGLPILCSSKDGDYGVRKDADIWPEEDEEIELIADPLNRLIGLFFNSTTNFISGSETCCNRVRENSTQAN